MRTLYLPRPHSLGEAAARSENPTTDTSKNRVHQGSSFPQKIKHRAPTDRQSPTMAHPSVNDPDGYWGVYLSGDTATHMRFSSRFQFQLWIALVEDIKDKIATINERRMDREARFGTEDPALERDSYLQWLKLVAAFRSGQRRDDYVPWDVRAAVNDVEQGVGVATTEWNLLE